MKSLWVPSLSLMIANSRWCSAFIPIRLRGHSPTFLPSITNYLDDLHTPSTLADLGNDQKYDSDPDALATKEEEHFSSSKNYPNSQSKAFGDYLEELTKSFDIYAGSLHVATNKSPSIVKSASIKTESDSIDINSKISTSTEIETKEQSQLSSTYMDSPNQSFSSYVNNLSETTEQTSSSTSYLDTLKIPSAATGSEKDQGNVSFLENIPIIKSDPASYPTVSPVAVTETKEQTPSYGNYLEKLNTPSVPADRGSGQKNDSYLDNLSNVKSDPVAYPSVITAAVSSIDNQLSNLKPEPVTDPSVSTADVTEIKEEASVSGNKYLKLNAPDLERLNTPYFLDNLSQVKSEPVTYPTVTTDAVTSTDNQLSKLKPEAVTDPSVSIVDVTEIKEESSLSGNKYLKLNAPNLERLNTSSVPANSETGQEAYYFLDNLSKVRSEPVPYPSTTTGSTADITEVKEQTLSPTVSTDFVTEGKILKSPVQPSLSPITTDYEGEASSSKRLSPVLLPAAAALLLLGLLVLQAVIVKPADATNSEFVSVDSPSDAGESLSKSLIPKPSILAELVIPSVLHLGL